MKKVLIITYYWPPASGPGVQRWLKFAKYLPAYGWEPIILTVKDGSYPATDSSLIKDIPEDLQVIKTKTLEPFTLYNMLLGKKGKYVEVGTGVFTKKQGRIGKLSNYIRANYFIPDARVGWKSYAIKAAKKVIQEEGIEHIITTGPPHSAHLIGLELKKILNIKWLADFRDPWVNIFYNRFLKRSDHAKRKDQNLENIVLHKSDCLLTVSHTMGQEFEDRNTRIETITNGYDDADISSYDERPQPFDKFTLYYMGNYKASQNIDALWNAIAQLSAEYPDFSKSFRMLFIGNQTSDFKERLTSHGIAQLIDCEDFQEHNQVIHKMMKSQMLFFPIPNVSENKIILTGKIFEYLASKLPLLSIGPVDGEAARVLKETARTAMLDYEDQAGVKIRILQNWKDWKALGHVPLINNDFHKKYNRKDLAGRVAEILSSL